MQEKDWDGRISDDNKKWAKAFPIPRDADAWGSRPAQEYVCSHAHPGLINLFVKSFRKEQEREKEKKPSVLKKLKEVSADTPTKAPSRKKEVEL